MAHEKAEVVMLRGKKIQTSLALSVESATH